MIPSIFYHHLCLYFYIGKRSKRHRIMSWRREVVNLCFNPIVHAHSSMPLMRAIMIFWRKLLQMFFRKGEKKPQTHTHRKKTNKQHNSKKSRKKYKKHWCWVGYSTLVSILLYEIHLPQLNPIFSNVPWKVRVISVLNWQTFYV